MWPGSESKRLVAIAETSAIALANPSRSTFGDDSRAPARTTGKDTCVRTDLK
jgi:hypothetical protein